MTYSISTNFRMVEKHALNFHYRTFFPILTVACFRQSVGVAVRKLSTQLEQLGYVVVGVLDLYNRTIKC
jgi:hypothetical protein